MTVAATIIRTCKFHRPFRSQIQMDNSISRIKLQLKAFEIVNSQVTYIPLIVSIRLLILVHELNE